MYASILSFREAEGAEMARLLGAGDLLHGAVERMVAGAQGA